MSRQEKRLLAVVFTVFAVLFYRASLANYFLLQLDTAYFLESIERLRRISSRIWSAAPCS